MKRSKLIAANWKMNHGVDATIKFVTELLRQPLNDAVDVVICPPFTSLSTLQIALSEVATPVMLGAQNCHFAENGAFTGEISADFLAELGVTHVILGHSERRALFAESNELIAKKVARVVELGLKPILCVGETLAERESGQTLTVIDAQLEGSLALLTTDHIDLLTLAYEPVWAIGTGKNATVEQAADAHVHIRQWIGHRYGTAYAQQKRILYGGSVKPDNARMLLANPEIDGALVGGASLNATDFVAIVNACGIA